MLRITVPASEQWDEVNEVFISGPEQTLQLEHSLISLSKWESKWHKAFLGKEEKSKEETLDYIRCMTLNQNIDTEVYHRLTPQNIEQINAYISDPMTATHFNDDGIKHTGREIITSELIYYWMVSLNIPVEFEKWHLNRLLTLIKVCNIKNTPPKKMSKGEIMRRNAALNAARRKKLGSKG